MRCPSSRQERQLKPLNSWPMMGQSSIRAASEGHRMCGAPMHIVVGNGEGSAGLCWNCGRSGHGGMDCGRSAEASMVARRSSTGSLTAKTCFKCGSAGNMLAWCPHQNNTFREDEPAATAVSPPSRGPPRGSASTGCWDSYFCCGHFLRRVCRGRNSVACPHSFHRRRDVFYPSFAPSRCPPCRAVFLF